MHVTFHIIKAHTAMKQANTNLDLWMRQNAHVHTGEPFQCDDYSCIPVFSENKDNKQIAFLLSKDDALLLVYQDALLPEDRSIWVQVWRAYHKNGSELMEAMAPSETWFG